MNFVGKSLTAAVLIMSVLFMMTALAVYATHKNWRNAVMGQNGLQSQLSLLRDAQKQLQADAEKSKNVLAMERAARKETVSVLEMRAQESREGLLEKQEQYDSLLAQNREAEQALKSAQADMKRLRQEVEALRISVQKAQQDRDEQFATVQTLSDQLAQSQGQVDRLTKRREQLVSQISRMSLVLDRNDLTEYDPVDDIPPRLDGVVTVVRDTNLIEVSLGSDEGLRRGHTLEVYRQGGAYLGRVIVIETSPDRAVTRILPEYRQGIIRRGDRVATKLI